MYIKLYSIAYLFIIFLLFLLQYYCHLILKYTCTCTAFLHQFTYSLWHGQWWGILRLCCCCCLFSAIVHSLSWSLSGSDQVRAGTVPVWGRGTAQYVLCEGGELIDTSQTLPLVPIGCVDSGAVDSCKSNYITADLYLILLSDHNENFSKYYKKISYRLQL